MYLVDTDGTRTATVVVGEDQLSLAIGRDGQNARLAAKLTGWRIDIKSLTEAGGDAIKKLQNNPELAAMLPAAVDALPVVQEVLAKKAENRPVTPEEYTILGQFIDRIEKRLVQPKQESESVSVQAGDESATSARADIPATAFKMPLEQANIKEHVFNILTEAGFETVGGLMFSLKTDPNRVLGLPGVGPKAIQNIEESLAALTFPEPEPEPVKAEEPVAVATEPAPEAGSAEADIMAAVMTEEEASAAKKSTEKKEKKPVIVEEADENAKDGVSLDELFKMKPEIFQGAAAVDEDADKKKGKKGKKKSVELEFDENSGTVVGRKIHKRGDDDAGGGDWE